MVIEVNNDFKKGVDGKWLHYTHPQAVLHVEKQNTG